MISHTTSIHFHFLTDPFYFPKRGSAKQFLLSIFKNHSKKIQAINYIFCTDEYLLSLNKEYLQHNYFTDIITFELSEKGKPLLADIYISVDRAKENAQTFKVSKHHEILRLLIHGTLHLCGFKDKTKEEIDEMRQQENFNLNNYLFHVKRKSIDF